MRREIGRHLSEHYRYLVPDDSDASVHGFFERHGAILTAEKIAEGLLPYTVLNNPNYTLHDLDHSFRVCDNMNHIIDILPESSRPSETEVVILYQAALLHDIGMAFISRDKESGLGITHGRMSARILEIITHRPYMEEGFWSLGSDAHIRILCDVIESHCLPLHNDGRGGRSFEDVPDIVNLDGETIRLRRICSILCIADGLDIGNNRINDLTFEILRDREILVEVSDLTGSQSVPYILDSSARHWEMERHTSMSMDAETGSGRVRVFIEVQDEAERDLRLGLVRYLRQYFEVLDICADIIVTVR